MKSFYQFILALVFIGSMSSCYDSSIIQTAKPMDKGQVEGGVAWSSYSLNEGVNLPSLESGLPRLHFRVGLGRKTEVGFSNMGYGPGLMKFDLKGQLYQSANRKFNLSTGVIFNLMPLDGFEFTGFDVPIYLSFMEEEKVTPYIAQKFGYVNDFLGGSTRYSGGAGLRFQGDIMKFYVEYSYSREFYGFEGGGLNHGQFTIGLAFRSRSRHEKFQLPPGY